MKNHYNLPNRLTQLQDEILAVVPGVQPVDGEAILRVEGLGDDVWITLPDDATVEIWEAIAAIVAAHTPTIPPPPPDWDSFRMATTLSPAYQRIIGHSSQTLAIANTLVWLIGQVGTNASLFPQVAGCWNAIAALASPTESEIEELNSIAASANVPFFLNAEGQLGGA